MAKTKILNNFTADTPNYLEQKAGVSNIFIANVADVEVKTSVRFGLTEGFAFIIKDVKIPVGTTLKVLENQLIQTPGSKVAITTDTTGGIEVVYTAL